MLGMAISLIDTIRNGDVQAAKKMLQQHRYANIDAQTSRQDGTALYWACSLGFIDLIHLLIFHGADVNAKTEWGATPLCAAADNNHTQAVRILLNDEVDVNSQTGSGDTSCHLATYRGFSAVVQMLVESGADLSIRNNKDHTVMDVAGNSGHSEIEAYLHAVSGVFNRSTLMNTQALPRVSGMEMFSSTREDNSSDSSHKSRVNETTLDNYAPRSRMTRVSSAVTCDTMECCNSTCQTLGNDCNDLSTFCHRKCHRTGLSHNNLS